MITFINPVEVAAYREAHPKEYVLAHAQVPLGGKWLLHNDGTLIRSEKPEAESHDHPE